MSTDRLSSGFQLWSSRGTVSNAFLILSVILSRADAWPPAQFANDPDTLHVIVRLTARIQDGPPVTSDRDDFGISLPRGGGPELVDAINQMLGRDPEQHRPPRLSWTQLIDAFANVGVSVTAQELIDVPLTIEFSAEVEARLADARP